MDPLHPAHGKPPRAGAREAYLAIERFLKASRQPVLMEPGEDPLPIASDTFALKCQGETVVLESWNETRNLVRRIRGIRLERRGRLEVDVERFGRLTGTLALVDLDNPSNRDADRRGARLKYRELFRRSLRRQFPDWRLAELSTEQDLHNSLSPSYPRALLRKGKSGMAAIGAAEDSPDPDGALSFGLIWLDYLRRREHAAIEGLAIFVPAGAEHTTCHRIRFLNPHAARYAVFVQDPRGHEDAVDPGDYTNLDTRLEPCRRPLAESGRQLIEWVERLSRNGGVERRDRPDGSVSLAVHGLEFARAAGEELLFGLDQKHAAASQAHLDEIERLAREFARMRNADADDRANPLYTSHPEAWLESQVRSSVESLDPALYSNPVYGQVPQVAGGDRSVIDLLTVDRDGRLAVIEVKAEQSVRLPLQALDYWMRVKWHVERGEFSGQGYFPGIPIRTEAPRLILLAPALEYHPSNKTVLKYFSPQIAVERLGVGLEWKRDLKVMFRVPGIPWP